MKEVAEMDWVEVNAMIESCTWPADSPVAPYVGNRGSDADRKAALVAALDPPADKNT